MKWWVSMTDTFMSGWGRAEDKINKLVFECDDIWQADIVMRNANRRDEMKYINLCSRKPRYYPKDKYLVQYKTKETYPNWYVDNTNWR
jgi:hypothetical protein